jgi:phosphate ABC transporter phosphate-binding protein
MSEQRSDNETQPFDPEKLNPADLDPTLSPNLDFPGDSTPSSIPSDIRILLNPPRASGELCRLEAYSIRTVLGIGGMGVVLAAWDETLRRPVAIKMMKPQIASVAGSRERFLREARMLANLTHENIVPIFHVQAPNQDIGVPYIVMPLLPGETLESRLNRGPNLSVPELHQIATEVARGLLFAHEAGIIHRDIKPGNIWLERLRQDDDAIASTGFRVRILDFGLARDQHSDTMTKSGAFLGTAAYASPEQIEGYRLDHRSDLFSLGTMLYRATTGKMPFEGPGLMSVMRAVCEHTPTPIDQLRPELPSYFTTLIDKLLQKNPANRPASAREILRILNASSAEVAIATEGNGANRIQRKSIDILKAAVNRSPIAMVIVIAFALVVGFLFGLLNTLSLFSPDLPAKSESKEKESIRIKMAGSSLISSLMNDWLDKYQAQTVCKVSYDAVGSGDGLSLLAQRQILLGATDAPIPDPIRVMAKNDPLKGDIVAIPLVMSGVSVAYNLPEIKDSSPLRFDGPTLARIYLGEIKNWNHEDMKKLNPSLAERLPNLPIQVGIREDGSGTSYIWTSYLASASAEWKLKGYEPSTQPEWPSTLWWRLTGKGNDGLAQRLEKTPGSIGYLGASSIEKHKLQAALIKNKAGQFVSANNSTLRDAVYSGVQEGVDLEKISLVNQPYKNAYPIVGVTWGAFFTTHANKRESQELAKFLNWVLDSGDNAALIYGFVPLSLELKDRAKLVIKKLETK